MPPAWAENTTMPANEKGYGDWVIATWTIYYDARLHFVARINGEPHVLCRTTTCAHDAYGWNSYHAARKYQREHSALEGYIVVNLAECRKQSELVKALEENRYKAHCDRIDQLADKLEGTDAAADVAALKPQPTPRTKKGKP